MSLAGKTLFITGASRDIGLAIALKAANDGANIALAAARQNADDAGRIALARFFAENICAQSNGLEHTGTEGADSILQSEPALAE